MTRGPVVILGAGVAGLAAAYRAKELGVDAEVYEAAARPGGLLDNFTLRSAAGDWVFDNAVHLSFATEPEVRAVFDRTPYRTHDAKALNYDRPHWLRHPVQNNMAPLPAEEKADLLVDLARHLAAADADAPIENYRDWLVRQYGPMIAERWPLRYTRKYWTLPAEALGTQWIGSRMRVADLREVAFGAMSAQAPNTYYISTMRYPEQGGYRAFLDPLVAAAHIHCDHRVVRIDPNQRLVGFANGVTVPYDALISTLPLPELVKLIDEVPEEIAAAASSLFATSIDLVCVGINRPDVAPSLWFYIYDEDILAARVYSASWKSPRNAPAGHSALQFEIYASPRNPQRRTPEQLIEHCLDALETMQLARRDEVVLTHHKRLAYGNVVFDTGMEARRDTVRAWVEAQGIALAGRFGEWDYLWSNQAFMSGYRAAEAVLS